MLLYYKALAIAMIPVILTAIYGIINNIRDVEVNSFFTLVFLNTILALIVIFVFLF